MSFFRSSLGLEISADHDDVLSELLPHPEEEFVRSTFESEPELLPHVGVELVRLTLFCDDAPQLLDPSTFAALLMVFVFLPTRLSILSVF